MGTGPFKLAAERGPAGQLKPHARDRFGADEEVSRREEVLPRRRGSAEAAIRSFAAAKADLVLGGTFADLPFAQRVKLPRNSLRFDPAIGTVRVGSGSRRRGRSTSPTSGGCCRAASTATP